MTMIFHAGLFGQGHPLLGVELHGIELLGEFLVLRDRHVRLFHEPLAVVGLALPLARGHRVDAPVDEQPEAGLGEPFHPGGPLLGRFDGVAGAVGGEGGKTGPRAGHGQQGCQASSGGNDGFNMRDSSSRLQGENSG